MIMDQRDAEAATSSHGWLAGLLWSTDGPDAGQICRTGWVSAPAAHGRIGTASLARTVDRRPRVHATARPSAEARRGGAGRRPRKVAP